MVIILMIKIRPKFFSRGILKIVSREGLEPTRLSAIGPKPIASANFATCSLRKR